MFTTRHNHSLGLIFLSKVMPKSLQEFTFSISWQTLCIICQYYNINNPVSVISSFYYIHIHVWSKMIKTSLGSVLRFIWQCEQSFLLHSYLRWVLLPVEGPLIQKSIYQWSAHWYEILLPVEEQYSSGRASLVIDFCISGPSTGNSNYKNLLPVRRPLIWNWYEILLPVEEQFSFKNIHQRAKTVCTL